MNRNEIEALMLLKDRYELYIGDGYKALEGRLKSRRAKKRNNELVQSAEFEIDRFNSAKRATIKTLQSFLTPIGYISALEVSRASGGPAYLDGRDHRYVVCTDAAAFNADEFRIDKRNELEIFVEPMKFDGMAVSTEKVKVFSVNRPDINPGLMTVKADMPETYPSEVYKRTGNVLSTSNDLELLHMKLEGFKSKNLVVVDTGERYDLHNRDPQVHSHLINRVAPAFKYFSQFNSPHSSIAAAKVVVCGELIRTAHEVIGMSFERFDEKISFLKRALGKLDSKLVNTHPT